MNKYIRQEKLKEIGAKGQLLLKKSSVAIVGAGGTGSYSAQLLARAGIGKLILIDKDSVDEVNLHRQTLFDEKDIGKSKVLASKEKLNLINSKVKIEIIQEYLSKENLEILDNVNLILDCTDNMNARHIINDYCAENDKIWIYSAAVGTKGNVMVVDDYKRFKDIFNTGETFDNCQEIGVINSVVAMTSAIQVTKAIKILTKKEYDKALIRFDIYENTYEKIN